MKNGTLCLKRPFQKCGNILKKEYEKKGKMRARAFLLVLLKVFPHYSFGNLY